VESGRTASPRSFAGQPADPKSFFWEMGVIAHFLHDVSGLLSRALNRYLGEMS
jgi:hypothetical protein